MKYLEEGYSNHRTTDDRGSRASRHGLAKEERQAEKDQYVEEEVKTEKTRGTHEASEDADTTKRWERQDSFIADKRMPRTYHRLWCFRQDGLDRRSVRPLVRNQRGNP